MVKRIMPASKTAKIKTEINKIIGEFFSQKKEKEFELNIQEAQG